jgi:hypothetical protein
MWVERRLKAEFLPFPKPLKFGGPTSTRRWRLSEVEQWEVARTKANEKTAKNPAASSKLDVFAADRLAAGG